MNYHILQQDPKQRSVQVVFHIPIPAAGTNEAGLTWRQAVVSSLGGSDAITSEVGNISPEELTQLKAGELFEKRETVKFSSVNLTNAQRKAEIEAKYAEVCSDVVVEKQVALAWMGYAADVT